MGKIDEIRESIDNIDSQMLELFQKRMDLSKEVAEYKKENNMELYHLEREEEIIHRAKNQVKEEYEKYAEIFLRNIMDLSKKLQNAILK